MMSIRAQAEAALAATLEAVGDAVKITNKQTAITQELMGQVTRVDTMVDPLSGARIHAPHTAVAVRLSSLTALPDEGWPVEVQDVTGGDVTGVMRDIRIDRMQGILVFRIENEEIEEEAE